MSEPGVAPATSFTGFGTTLLAQWCSFPYDDGQRFGDERSLSLFSPYMGGESIGRREYLVLLDSAHTTRGNRSYWTTRTDPCTQSVPPNRKICN